MKRDMQAHEECAGDRGLDADGQLSAPFAPSTPSTNSPTPTFVGTDEPARAARRRRWHASVPVPAVAITGFSFLLMVGGVAGYAAEIPSILERPAAVAMLSLDGLEQGLQDGAAQASGAGPTAGKTGPVALSAGGSSTGSAAAALGIGDSANVLGASLTSTSATPAATLATASVDDSFKKAVEQASGSASGSTSGSGSSGSGSSAGGSNSANGTNSNNGSNGDSGSTDGKGGNGESGSSSKDTDVTPTPAPAPEPEPDAGGLTDAEEDAIHQQLLVYYANLNSCVEKMNQIVADFNADAAGGSRAVRQSHADAVDRLDSQTLTEFLAVRNYSPDESSKWMESKYAIQRSYIALDNYLSVFASAWSYNLDYDNPADGYDVWMAPIWEDQDSAGNSTSAAKFNAEYAGIAL